MFPFFFVYFLSGFRFRFINGIARAKSKQNKTKKTKEMLSCADIIITRIYSLIHTVLHTVVLKFTKCFVLTLTCIIFDEVHLYLLKCKLSVSDILLTCVCVYLLICLFFLANQNLLQLQSESNPCSAHSLLISLQSVGGVSAA